MKLSSSRYVIAYVTRINYPVSVTDFGLFFNPAYFHRKLIFNCSEKRDRRERAAKALNIQKLFMVLRKAITTKITTSGFLVIQSFCKCEYILIFLQEHRTKVTKIGSNLIKARGWHFNILIKVLIVIKNLLKLKVDLSDVLLHVLRKFFNCCKCFKFLQVLQPGTW